MEKIYVHPGEWCDYPGHGRELMYRASDVQARIAELEAERDKWRERALKFIDGGPLLRYQTQLEGPGPKA